MVSNSSTMSAASMRPPKKTSSQRYRSRTMSVMVLSPYLSLAAAASRALLGEPTSMSSATIVMLVAGGWGEVGGPAG
jgi:hypothetical protein